MFYYFDNHSCSWNNMLLSGTEVESCGTSFISVLGYGWLCRTLLILSLSLSSFWYIWFIWFKRTLNSKVPGSRGNSNYHVIVWISYRDSLEICWINISGLVLQVWDKLQKIGREMVLLATGLSNVSRVSYQKQVWVMDLS